MRYDTIVIGVGGMGSAIVDQLAARGQRVLGLEQFGVAHDRGASHGQTRIVRQAYFESPAYIPLLRRAYELWAAMPVSCRMRPVGCLMIGHEDSPVIIGATASAAEWDIPLDALGRADVGSRFPQFRLSDGELAVFESNAGYVRPEATVTHLIERAVSRGADVRTHVSVLDWELDGSGITVRTSTDSFQAEQLVLAAGAWTPQLAARLQLPVHIERRVMHFWLPQRPQDFGPT